MMSSASTLMPEDIPIKVMIFAAGLGTRMGSLTKSTPKPLLPVMGKPILQILLEKLYNFSNDKQLSIVVNCFYLSEQLKIFLKNHPKVLISEEKELLDTGGGLKKGIEILKAENEDPILTINSDIIWNDGELLNDLFKAWKECRADLLMLVKRDPTGVFTLPEATLADAGSTQRYAYTGIQIIKPKTVYTVEPYKKKFSLFEIYKKLLLDRDTCYPLNTKLMVAKSTINHLGTAEEYSLYI